MTEALIDEETVHRVSEPGQAPEDRDLRLRQVATTWWPLALSWICMAAELPALTAVVSRLPDPKVNLAAYGGVVFPLALIIESPVIMLLAASTALTTDRESYRRLYRIMMTAGLGLTVLHALVAFTPLFDAVVGGVMHAPPDTIPGARLGLAIMLPWTWAIAHRRFHQGLLIRSGRARAVGLGTVLRIATVLSILAVCLRSGRLPGVAVACLGVIGGVLVELVFVAAVSRSAVAELGPRRTADPPLTSRGFLGFYLPLVLTSLLSLLALPIVAAALGRMPRALDSLAAWPAVDGILFILQSGGVALNEVVLALLGRRGAHRTLKRFTVLLTMVLGSAGLLLASSPLGGIWFAEVLGLRSELVPLARLGLWISVPVITLTPWISWFQGRLLHARRTRGVTEATVINLLLTGSLLGTGIRLKWDPGLAIGAAAMTIGTIAQVFWLARRCRLLTPDR
ncbi:MAG: hypothetical protein ACH37Z_05065 [Anaerolineae bacterium]